MTHDTFILERTYPVPLEKVFSAFADPAKKRVWFAEAKSHDIEQFEMHFQVGGKERIASRFNATTPFPGALLVNDSTYLDIVPENRIVIASTMAFGDKRFSASLATFEFLAAEQGTSMILTHQTAFFEGSDGPEIRQSGWKTLLGQLTDFLAR